MADTPENIAIFNEMVGLIFDQLYRSFPQPTGIDVDQLAEAMGLPLDHDLKLATREGRLPIDEGRSITLFATDVTNWLLLEGFVHGERFGWNLVLSSKALAALDAVPDGLEKPLGARLGDAVKDAGSVTGRAAIAEIVGLIFGAAARGFTGVPPG